MKKLVLYIHGKGGCAEESEHYRSLFPDYEVIGLDYQTFTPWETGKEICEAVTMLNAEYVSITLIANSIGAFFSMNAGIDEMIHKAYFISPIVDMEQLVFYMMSWANVTEKELEEKGVIHTDFGEDLSWDYLCYLREHPVHWTVPTRILYGGHDNLISYETVAAFSDDHGAKLTVMENGEHWFHTDEQIRFMDKWIRECEADRFREIMITTERLRLYPASLDQMETMIASEQDEELKKAYSEMLDGCLRYPDQWEWYAIWMIEKKDGTRVGDLCFKGLGESGAAEIGYGILEECQGQGYATEAVQAVCRWAFRHAKVKSLEAETDAGNMASQKVLEKCGFLSNGSFGEEGPRFTLKRKNLRLLC